MQDQKDRIKKFIAPVFLAGLFILLFAGLDSLFIWCWVREPIPLWVMGLLLFLPAACIVGVIVALVQRLKELKGGEEDEALKY